MHLNKLIPFAAFTFVIAGMASMGLPGFSGFVAELMIVIGVWHSYPTLIIVVAIGLVAGVAYIWRAMQMAFFAGTDTVPAQPEHPLPPITFPERIGAGILICASVIVGTFPQLFLNVIHPALNSPLFQGLRKGGW
jgi:NADH-quinone oxidoreductase subunit M